MIPPFDIFSVQTAGGLIWQATAETLDVARLRVKTLTDAQPGDYVICSQATGHTITVKADGSVTGSPGPIGDSS
jgi:hypothetical protein